MADTRLKIAVFIDFDNIEIGVKSTLGVPFDIGVVLEALKERGDVVSKIAYGDWTRAGDYSRSLTQHATKLVQRNLTPGGDKNGADINLALDALEMAFTHNHINAYVIVGGDSDFITLVEKLKQYDKQIFVVGGRAFTSLVMQRNCHEFIAYENLVGSRRSPERGRQSSPVTQAPLDQVVALVRRALKVLSDREVSPQLGLLKSTLLQLDSTFSERTYGAGSFRDFAQKLESAGHVVLRESGRNVLVELSETASAAEESPGRQARAEAAEPAQPAHGRRGQQFDVAPRAADGIREVRRLFQSAQNPPRWPMYVRQAKQFLRNVDSSFDERKFGFGSLVDLMRACQREGLFRIERDRQGVMRIFPGNVMQSATEPILADTEPDEDFRGNVAEPEERAAEWTAGQEDVTEPEVVEADAVQEIAPPPPVIDVEAAASAEETAAPRRSRSRNRTRPQGTGRTPRKAQEGVAVPRARKTPSRPRAPRARARAREAQSEE
ncbi:MAG TPA: NYN domain-containing protein [Vicinamibacterales bacterium]|nr:NYN domain-containing protein [Vicinamibacterales bacterium]